ncbi:MAG: chloride channel protein [Planctomycetaceae bacterium]|nr:chloride channel protein [Planctomycetaceae bacterium]MCB9949737.1 chloride channel protein [Planctomycetaceae bacterium]
MLVGVIAGLGGIVFQLAGHVVVEYTSVAIAGYSPPEAKGEAAEEEQDELVLSPLEASNEGATAEPDDLDVSPPEAETDATTVEAHDTPVFSPWLLIAVMTGGGLISGALVYTFAPEAEGHGTDAAIDAFHNKRGIINWRVPIVKTLASAITLGTCGSGGREGPIAQIGASFGSYLGSVLNLSARDRRILLAAGMGAGVGAVFRAPLAGALFAAEILYSDSEFEAEVFVPAATASIIGYSVFRLWLPESIRHEPLFGFPSTPFLTGSPLELIPYAVLAVILVAVGAFYIKTFYGVHKLFEKVPTPKMFRPAIGAALAGLIGIGLYYGFAEDRQLLAVLSTGYGVLQKAVTSPGSIAVGPDGSPLLAQCILILFTVSLVKIITTSLTISSGGSGGVFGPSMVIGGCVGGAVGLFFNHFFPHIVPRPEAFAIVGMAGFFSGCAHAPFSTIIMVSEMTGGYGLLLPTMWVSTITFVLGRPWKLYIKQVRNRLESPAHRGDFLVDVLEGMRVADVYDKSVNYKLIPESTSLEDIVHILAETKQHYFPVVDTQNHVIGIFSADDVRSYLYDPTLWKLANARDVMNGRIVAVTPEDDLNTAIRCFTAIAIDELPVVDATDRGVLLGTLRHKETIAAYNRRLMEFKKAAADHE